MKRSLYSRLVVAACLGLASVGWAAAESQTAPDPAPGQTGQTTVPRGGGSEVPEVPTDSTSNGSAGTSRASTINTTQLSGKIAAMTGDTVTIQGSDGRPTDARLSSDTIYQGAGPGDLKVGSNVTAWVTNDTHIVQRIEIQ